MRSTAEIVAARDNLKVRYGDRDRRYKDAYYAYRGEYNKLEAGYSADPLKLDVAGSGQRLLVWNLVHPIVEAKRMLLNRLPGIKIAPPIPGDPAARDKADKLEKVLYTLWDACAMVRQHGFACQNLALYNATPWFVRWDQELDMPTVTVRNPGECYPAFKSDGHRVAFCIFAYERSADELYELFPDKRQLLSKHARTSTAQLNVTEYVDQDSYVIIIGDKSSHDELFRGDDSKRGFCPVVITPGIPALGDPFPLSSLDQVVPLNHYLNRFQTMSGDSLEGVLFPGVVLQGEGSDQVAWNTGPRAVNRLPDGVMYQHIQPAVMPQEVFVHLQRIEMLMRRMVQFPESASGEMDASVITGKAVSRLQGVMTGMAAETQAAMQEDLQAINRMILSMLDNYRPSKKFTMHTRAPGTLLAAPGRSNEPFTVEFTPEQDIAGYYENQLIYSPFGTDWSTSIVTGMQLVQGRIWSHQHLMDMLPGSGDATGMMKEIEEEDRRRMEQELQLQTQAQQQLAQFQANLQSQQAQQQAQAQAATAPSGAGGGLAPTAQTPEGASASGPAVGGLATTTALPLGQPQVMGTGEPFTGREGFPLSFEEVQPYATGLEAIQAGQTGVQGEALPGKTMVTAEEIIAAITAATNRKGFKALNKLQGEVYLVGELAERGFTDGPIQFAITVKADQQVIVTALPQYAALGLLQFRVIEPGTAPEVAIPVRGV